MALSRTHMATPVEHIKHPGTLGGVPLMCGRPWLPTTRVSYAIETVTCGQCQTFYLRWQADRAALRAQVVDG
jgi:hypothetical protein